MRVIVCIIIIPSVTVCSLRVCAFFVIFFFFCMHEVCLCSCPMLYFMTRLRTTPESCEQYQQCHGRQQYVRQLSRHGWMDGWMGHWSVALNSNESRRLFRSSGRRWFSLTADHATVLINLPGIGVLTLVPTLATCTATTTVELWRSASQSWSPHNGSSSSGSSSSGSNSMMLQ